MDHIFEIGEQFGRWEVMGTPEPKQYKTQLRMVVPCRCSCGTKRLVLVQSLLRKDRSNLSCGCWKRERTASIVGETRWKDSHGLSRHPLYQLWKRIIRRCYSPGAHNYKWYGGAGVQVWEGWRHDAGAFIAYIEENLGPRPSPRHSIDRIDPYGNYAPGKVRWATPVEQARNRRSRFSD